MSLSSHKHAKTELSIYQSGKKMKLINGYDDDSINNNNKIMKTDEKKQQQQMFNHFRKQQAGFFFQFLTILLSL